jgi:hypothetical protein
LSTLAAGSKIEFQAGSALSRGDHKYIAGPNASPLPYITVTTGKIVLEANTFTLDGEAVLNKALEFDEFWDGLLAVNGDLTLKAKLTVDKPTTALDPPIYFKVAGNMSIASGGELDMTDQVSGSVYAQLGTTSAALGKIIVQPGGTFHNSIPSNWEMIGDSAYEFHAGSEVYSGTYKVIGNISPRINLSAGTLSIGKEKVTLAGTARVTDIPSSDAFLWPGFGLIVDSGVLTIDGGAGTFTLNGIALTVNQGATFTLRNASKLILNDGSTVTVNGTFNYDFYNNGDYNKVEYTGSDNALIFKPGSIISLPSGGLSPDYIGGPGALLTLSSGQVVFEEDGFFNLDGVATVNHTLKVPKAAIKGDLTISGLYDGSLIVHSAVTDAADIFALDGNVLVDRDGSLVVNNSTVLGGDKKLAKLGGGSTIEVSGTFVNGIMPNWDISTGGKFIFNGTVGTHVWEIPSASSISGVPTASELLNASPGGFGGTEWVCGVDAAPLTTTTTYVNLQGGSIKWIPTDTPPFTVSNGTAYVMNPALLSAGLWGVAAVALGPDGNIKKLDSGDWEDWTPTP